MRLGSEVTDDHASRVVADDQCLHVAGRPAFGQGQGGRKVPVVGLLSILNVQRVGRHVDAVVQGMRDLGWVEGRNFELRLAFADGDLQRLDALAADLVMQKVDLIMASESAATRAARRATASIPIVILYVPNAVGSGFVASLDRPGGNITGMTTQHEDSIAKLIELLHEAVPAPRRIAVLLNATTPTHIPWWAGAQSACKRLGLEPLRVTADVPAQLDGAVAHMMAIRAEAVVIAGDGMHYSERLRLLELLRPTRLPVAAGIADFARAGALLSFGADSVETVRYAATFVDKILKGARPADLPVEQATRFELVLNLSTAKSLGLTFPKAVLLRANEVIE